MLCDRKYDLNSGKDKRTEASTDGKTSEDKTSKNEAVDAKSGTSTLA